jgi:hypothetical protein
MRFPCITSRIKTLFSLCFVISCWIILDVSKFLLGNRRPKELPCLLQRFPLHAVNGDGCSIVGNVGRYDPRWRRIIVRWHLQTMQGWVYGLVKPKRYTFQKMFIYDRMFWRNSHPQELYSYCNTRINPLKEKWGGNYTTLFFLCGLWGEITSVWNCSL